MAGNGAASKMTTRAWLKIGIAIAAANFAVFIVVALSIGGDAVNGFARSGHYFLDNKGHLSEVGPSLFLYSRWHVYSLLVTQPLGMLCGWLLGSEEAD